MDLLDHLLASSLDMERHTPEARDIAREMLFVLPGGRRAYVRAVVAQRDAARRVVKAKPRRRRA